LCPANKVCSVKVEADTKAEDIVTQVFASDAKCVDKPKARNLTAQVAGDFCRFDYNCLSLKCVSNKCTALTALGGECVNSK
jgi:hypothetical protein